MNDTAGSPIVGVDFEGNVAMRMSLLRLLPLDL